MKRTWVVVPLVFCIAATGASGAIHRGKPPPARSVFGLADAGDAQALRGRDLDRYLDSVKGAGARWIRIGIYWSVIQRKGPRTYDWSAFDRVVGAAQRRQLAVLGVIVYAPSWARAPGMPDSAPPADTRDYAAFAGRTARHFARRGVHAYEVWNEPNIAASWRAGPDPARYTQMLKQAYAAIKSADPSATVVSGGLSPYGAYGAADSQGMNPLTFLEQMYANGAHGSMDAVGWHPYNFPWGLAYYAWSAWSQMSMTTPSARSLMRANGDAGKKIWATEWGAPTGTSSKSVTEAKQAKLVTNGLRRLNAWRWAGPAFLYNYRDKGTNLSDREQNFGIVRYDWSRKPAYGAFRRLAMRSRAHDR